MTDRPSQCQALNLSDEKRCTAEATSSNGLFCHFHSRQCHGLYRGYKNRNAKLDTLTAAPPPYLANTKKALVNNNFTDIDDETTIAELHGHLFRKYALLDRVIRARKLHHSRFFALSMDYGHQAYLDKLQSERTVTLCALENLERRTVEILYKQQKWLRWVEDCQDEEEKLRDSEKKKIKKEAALFRRHWKEVERRMQEKRRVENEKMQEEFLNKAFAERISEMSDEDASEWDPIEDTIEDERANFADMIKRLLWLPISTTGSAQEQEGVCAETPEKASAANQGERSSGDHASNSSPSLSGDKTVTTPKSAKKQAKKARAKAVKTSEAAIKNETNHGNDEVTSPMNESEEETRNRLLQGQKYDPLAGLKGTGGWQVSGTIENPTEWMGKTATLPAEEVEKLMGGLSEIRLLLFCRLLLSHATLLPAALRANTVEEFLHDKDVSSVDLRNLSRGDEPATNDEEDKGEDIVQAKHKKPAPWWGIPKESTMPEKWNSKHEKAIKNKREPMVKDPGVALDFGVIDNRAAPSDKVKISICGKTIWNYPSEKTMARGGWLHWTIMAKDTHLSDAIALCRNWNEFWELNILAIFKYFPSAHYVRWSGDRVREQFLQLGLIPYYHYSAAEKNTAYHQSGGHQHGRFHAVAETRNFSCFHVKRNDPMSRRFIKYLTMQTCDVCTLVRDGTDGRIIVQPPEEQLWLRREKFGPGRASKGDWRILKKVGKQLFEEIDKQREWRFGFDDYYDVWVWDNEPGKPYEEHYARINNTLTKAGRFRQGTDFYRAALPILKTLTRDQTTGRYRDIRPGESVDSLADDLTGPHSNFRFGKNLDKETAPEGLWYHEADALEDSILFPEETYRKGSSALVKTKPNRLTQWDEQGPDMNKFVDYVDTDEDSEDDEDDEDNYNEIGGIPDVESIKKGLELAKKGDDEDEEIDAMAVLESIKKTVEPAKKGDAESSQSDSLVDAIEPSETDLLLDRLVLEDEEAYPAPEPDPETDYFMFVEREQSKGK
ncbi:MAG: hypothetical protein M1822_000473 [Bathelium mastoideum]|nr:MAG: hypothetical protein M1822_000473 [Bathelium mastoideum]